MSRNRSLAALLGLITLVGCAAEEPASMATPPAGRTSSASLGLDRIEEFSPPAESAQAPAPRFEMLAADAGLDFERFDDIGPLRRILEVNGGGVGMLDFDADGRLDLFFTNGCRLPVQEDDRDTPSELFRNAGQMHFERTTTAARIEQFGFATGCTVGDYDGDGFDDLYVTAYGPNTMWRNNGDGTFSPLPAESGTQHDGWGTSAAFADFNEDGLLDLYVVNYLVESAESPTLCPHPDSPDGYVSCPPSKYPGADDVLLISDGTGGFRDATGQAGLAGRHGKGLGVVTCDLDGEPGLEIYVANDGEPNFLFVRSGSQADDGGNSDSLRFEEQALSSGVALSEAGFAQASMGIAAGDYNADGALDLFLTHFFEDVNTLYANRGGLVFEDVTRSSRLGPGSRMLLGFGTEFLDYDSDGRLDLIVANGHIEDRTWMSGSEPYRMRPQLYRNRQDGSFEDVTGQAGGYFQRDWLGRGLAVGDLDRDGRLDAAVNHQLAPSLVLHNQTDTPHRSLVLRLIGTGGNRNGVGARVELIGAAVPTVRQRIGGGSFQSASAGEIHLGLSGDAAAAAQVRVQWPGGGAQEHTLEAGTWVVVEGAAAWALRGGAARVNSRNAE